jgi:hypothetical protein
MVSKVDPNEGLAADAALAEDLGDLDARQKDQLAYYGGDEDDLGLDESADRGDNLTEETEDEDRGDEAKEEEEEADADDDTADADDEEADDEAADDGDEEDSEDEVEEEEEEEPAAKKEKGIPRARFNEVNTRMRQAEADLAALKAQKAAGEAAAVEKYDFDAAEDEYMALLLDGKTKDAGAKRREIREAEKADFKSEAKAETMQDVSAGQMERIVNSLSREAENMFPAFNQDSEQFNPAAVAKALTFMRGYQSEGLSPDDAFVAALADTIEIFDLGTEPPGDEVTKKEKGGKTTTNKPPIVKTKEKIAASKKAGKTPAGEGKGAADAGATVVDIEQLSEEELEAMPAATLARLRGDFM